MSLKEALKRILTLQLNGVILKAMQPNAQILMIAKTAPKRTFSAIFYDGTSTVVSAELWPVGLMT
jgi:hypothetical protein